MNLHVHISCGHIFSFLLVKYLGVEVLGHISYLLLLLFIITFIKTAKQLSVCAILHSC